MKRRDFIKLSAMTAGGLAAATPRIPAGADQRPPNVLFITTDDLNCDSVGVFGCEVPQTTPNLDRLASQGMRFAHAHVQVANCMPSRNVMQTGRYPHNSGVEGFYQVEYDYPLLADVLEQNGYFRAIMGKVGHSSPSRPYDWDMVLRPKAEHAGNRDPDAFRDLTADAIAASRNADKPFYLLMNITDPHKPWYGMDKRGNIIDDPNVPTRTYTEDEIVVPGFLPDFPVVRKELAHYYSSVRRADDSVGEILAALEQSGQADNTVVMFLSDHGMPFPFAKTNVYHHSTRTPWIVRWPGVVAENSIDDQHMISAVDFMPTVLDIAGAQHPAGLDGRSFLPLLQGRAQNRRDMVIKEYNENAGGGRHPMRSVETRKYGYIFNPWSNGTRKFRTATTGTLTYKKMQQAARTDPQIAARLDLFDHRVREEFYDYENDPDALHNLIDDPAYQDEINRLRAAIEAWMVKTGDHALEAFRNRDNDEICNAYVEKLQEESNERRRDRRQQRRMSGLLEIKLPKRAVRGQSVTITVHHTVPDNLGEQLVHVTLKDASGKRKIQRHVLSAEGDGDLEVTFDVPADLEGDAVCFAAFIGKDYPNCYQHIISRPVALE